MSLLHYEGPLGTFDYDTQDWELCNGCLKWRGGNKVCNLPKGITDCSNMFSNFEFSEQFVFDDFDTSKVTRMNGMFCNAKFPKGFKLGEMFNTSRVTEMCNMFAGCRFPEGFSLGEWFNTRRVWDMTQMFMNTEIPAGFSLGSKFYTNKTRLVAYKMFYYARFADDFTLGDKFSFETAVNLDRMFGDCVIPKQLKVPEVSSTDIAADMFEWSEFQTGFIKTNPWVLKLTKEQVQTIFSRTLIKDSFAGFADYILSFKKRRSA